MKKLMLMTGLLAGALAGGTSEAWAQKHYKELTYPPLGQIQMPPIERLVLDNGMVLFLVEDHELPLVEVSLLIGAGSVDDPPDKAGLAAITGAVLRTGGSQSMDGEKMDEVLESMASSVEFSLGLTTGSGSASALKEHFDATLAILADLLLHPAFPENKLQLAKVEHHSAIARRNDEPFGIANREFRKVIFGADSPYARQTEHATIEAIRREDLVRFHQAHFQPNNIMMAVVGDFQSREMADKIKRAFAAWSKGEFKRRPAPEVPYQFQSSVNLVQKSDLSQAHVWMGHLGGVIQNPDYPVLVLMDRILGVGGTSRLFKTVRSRMGLAYSVQGSYSCGYDHPEVFFATCQTKAESMSVALEAIRKEIDLMTRELVTEEELAEAKERFLNSFVFQFDSKAKIANRVMTYEFFRYPPDFLEKLRDRIVRTTREDILAAAKKYLRPDALRILVLGNAPAFDRPLSAFGQVREIDIRIPGEPAPEAERATQ
jgi:zinc protease